MLDKKVVDTLKSIVGDENVLTDAGDLLTYSYDGTPDQPQVLPEVVVMPESEEEIAYPEIPVPIADKSLSINRDAGAVIRELLALKSSQA